MTYRTARPAEGGQFHDRVEALARLERLSRSLTRGESKWIVIFGHRKIGKTARHEETTLRPFVGAGELAAVRQAARVEPSPVADYSCSRTM